MTGLLAQQESGRVDMSALREDRRRRLFDAMAAHGLDALILGRPANITFASGARQLWTSGARPFGPGQPRQEAAEVLCAATPPVGVEKEGERRLACSPFRLTPRTMKNPPRWIP